MGTEHTIRMGFGLCTAFVVTVAKYLINTYHFKSHLCPFFNLFTFFLLVQFSLLFTIYFPFEVSFSIYFSLPFAGAEKELGRGA